MACPGQNPVEVVPRSDMEVVRLRPGMYIGSTDARGLLHVLFELVTNSLAEAVAGHGRSVRVTLRTDGSAEVADDGRRGVCDYFEANRGVAKLVLNTVTAARAARYAASGKRRRSQSGE